jgi:tetratricopeptide (TPR) repeat protein
MRRLSLVLFLSILAALCGARFVVADQIRLSVEPMSGARLDRLAGWLKAVEQHVPGIEDDAVREVAAWPNDNLRMLWIDVNIVVQLMRSPRGATFRVRAEGANAASTIRYTAPQLQQLKTLACAAGGDEHCVATDAAAALDAGLVRVARAARAAKLRGDDNYVLRRGALLHLDASMLPARAPLEPASTVPSIGPRLFRVQVSDGRQVGAGMSAVHLEIARMVLDFVKLPGADRAAPGRDPMVRDWYRATAAWMAYHEDHDLLHLERGRAMFPDDPDLLFLSGCQHETFAAPHIQAAIQSASLPSGYSIVLESQRGELQRAETFFRRALELKSDHGEARLRFGRVLGLLGRHSDAARELRQAVASVDQDELGYFAQLFLGAEEESLGQYNAAFDAYQRAAVLYPAAQSPRLALSSLGHRRGDRAAALRALQPLFDVPSEAVEPDDPWWTYHIAPGRNVDELLEALRRPFLAERQQ